jgi:hypothetical protein
MTRGKPARQRKGQYQLTVEALEALVFPGQTWAFLGDFAHPTGASVDSGLNITIGGVTRLVAP